MPDLATSADIASWLELVREVEPLFGPMPEFGGTLDRSIARSGAWCVRDEVRAVVGGMILSRVEDAKINWLAVRRSSRGQGHGRKLVEHALRQFDAATEVVVDTFGEDNLEGRAARCLYKSFGFSPAEELEPGPEGGTRQRFRRRRPDG